MDPRRRRGKLFVGREDDCQSERVGMYDFVRHETRFEHADRIETAPRRRFRLHAFGNGKHRKFVGGKWKWKERRGDRKEPRTFSLARARRNHRPAKFRRHSPNGALFKHRRRRRVREEFRASLTSRLQSLFWGNGND